MTTPNTENVEQPQVAVGSIDLLGLFVGHHYYPRGGANDFQCFGDNAESLKQIYADSAAAWSIEEGGYPDPWGQIVDIRTMKVIWKTNEPYEWEQP